MSIDPISGRRQVDGPIRRVAIAPIAPGSSVDAQPATVVEEPVFVYHKPRRRLRLRWSRKLLFIPVALLLLLGGWFVYHAFAAVHNIIQRAGKGSAALNGGVSLSDLKGEGDGRINILVMGIGGAGHEGPDLSDTMIVWSIDPKTKDVAAISVPRDLYVKLGTRGYGKINAANAYGGPQLAEQAIQTVLGVPIHYYMVVDFSGFKQAVDAVGGVDIDVATALYDRQYPCDVGNGVCPYSQAAGHVHMTGAQALKYARCRHNDAGIGNCGNDYGRSARQQQVIAALRAKALSAGTLANPLKLTSLIDAVGNHVKTDLQLSDMKQLAKLASGIDPTKITNKVLDDAADNYLVGGVNIIPAAGYIYVPKAGNFNYDDIHDFAKNIFTDHYITDENARIEIQNGSGITGVAAAVAKSLKSAHYNVGDPVNAATSYTQTVIYDYSGGKKPYTINYLEKRFGVKAQRVSAPSVSPTVSPKTTPVPAPDIRIILGSDYKPSSTPLVN